MQGAKSENSSLFIPLKGGIATTQKWERTLKWWTLFLHLHLAIGMFLVFVFVAAVVATIAIGKPYID